MFKFIKLPKSIASWILIVLLAVHTGWVLNHLRLHSERAINPWKGGGYGMYTNLQPRPQFVVWTSDVAPFPLNRTTRFLRAETTSLLEVQSLTNYGRFFRCSPVSEFGLVQFVKMNRSRLKQHSIIKIRTREISKLDRSIRYRIDGQVKFDLAGDYVNYTSNFCGEVTSGRVWLKKSFGL
jgi:hypothetical protein